MRQRLLEARRRESGFTLIELLIVIVILGVLAAVVVLAVGAFSDRGEAAACKSDVKAVEVAVEAYRAKTGTYPTSLDDLVKDPNENYLRSLPNSTPDTGEYWIEYDSSSGAVTGYINNEGTDNDVLCGGGANGTATPGEPGGGGPGGGEEAPGAVTGLSVGSITQTSASVSWSAPSGGAAPTGYVVQWGTDPQFTGATEQNDDASPFPLSGLSPSTTYHVRVAAVNGSAVGPWTATTFTTTAAVTLPGAPGRPSVNCFNPSGPDDWDCTVTWTAPTTGSPPTSYTWQYSDKDSGSCGDDDYADGDTRSDSTTALSVTLDDVVSWRDYCVRVRATNAAGDGPWSQSREF